jgi:transcriptional regulator with XRE-family HTH domain
MREVRRRAGITQTSLARKIGTTQGYIGQIERGLDAPPTMANRIAAGLGVGVQELAGRDEATITLKLSDLSPEILAALTKQ